MSSISVNKKVASAGQWQSPITPAMIAGETARMRQTALQDGVAYWTESRPWEGGRTVIVAHDGNSKRDILPAPFSAGNRVHEYGGGDFCVGADRIWFSNAKDQAIYSVSLDGGEPKRLCKKWGWRFADISLDAHRGRLLAVAEIHQEDRPIENAIVAISLNTGEVEFLVQGEDFYASPKLSLFGDELCWISWNQPNMPWDETSLWVADLDDEGNFMSLSQIDDGGQSIIQPRWLDDGSLAWVSDRSNWWNLYCEGDASTPKALAPIKAECGQPQWNFDMSTWDVSDYGMYALATSQGEWRLGRVENKKFSEVELPYSWLDQLRVEGRKAVCLAGSPQLPTQVISVALDTGVVTVLASASDDAPPAEYISSPEAVSFPTSNGDTAHGLFYPPCNADYQLPDGELPPLIVRCHGGPTGAATTMQELKHQFWTSRGYAILDLNYRGSVGYGREYRRSLYGNWGVYDVDDCVYGAEWLAKQNKVDGERLLISGSSAGGYTVLSALTFRDVFKAGASYYGIGDMSTLMDETHKFEARYGDQLIGPAETHLHLYRERSPLFSAEKLSCPVIFFQGLDDKIVLPNQAQLMVDALNEKGVYNEHFEFEGEGHGFRKAETIETTLNAELAFYQKVLSD